MPDSPAILSEGTRTNTGVMRGRDVRMKLAGHLHPVAVDTIATLAEINHTNTLAVAELATMLEQMVTTMQGMTDIAQNMKDRSEQLLRAGTQAKEAAEGNTEA